MDEDTFDCERLESENNFDLWASIQVSLSMNFRISYYFACYLKDYFVLKRSLCEFNIPCEYITYSQYKFIVQIKFVT